MIESGIWIRIIGFGIGIIEIGIRRIGIRNGMIEIEIIEFGIGVNISRIGI